jgi:hypothetical protein
LGVHDSAVCAHAINDVSLDEPDVRTPKDKHKIKWPEAIRDIPHRQRLAGSLMGRAGRPKAQGRTIARTLDPLANERFVAGMTLYEHNRKRIP